MTMNRIETDPSRDAEQLFLDFGDRILDGEIVPPTNDLEATFLRVHRAPRANDAVSANTPFSLTARMRKPIVQNKDAPLWIRIARNRIARERHRRVLG